MIIVSGQCANINFIALIMPIIKILVKSKQFAQKTNQKVGKNFNVLILIIKQKVIIRVFPIYTGINLSHAKLQFFDVRVSYIHWDKPHHVICSPF